MAIGQVLREARIQQGKTQEDIGVIAYISPKTVSAIECGRRNVDPAVLGALVQRLDSPRLCMEAAAEITGGACCSPWLNGKGVDLHRSSVLRKLDEELREALEALSMVDLVNLPDPTDARAEQVYASLMQLLDVRVAVDHFVAVICQGFGYSVSSLYREHRQKLESRGYVRAAARKEPPQVERLDESLGQLYHNE